MGRKQLLYKYPPDFQKAEKHRQANRIFKGIQKDPNCDICECCDRKIGVTQAETSCCYDKNQFAFLGPGIPLLFAYIRNSILMLLIFCLVFAGFVGYSNYSSSYCIDTGGVKTCQYNIFNLLSFTNKINNSDYLSIQNYIVLGFVVINIIIFQLFRQIQQQCDDIVNSPSDYAIVLRRLPDNVNQKDIQKMVEERRAQLTLQQNMQTQSLKIDHIVLSYALGQYTKVNQTNKQNFFKAIQQNKLPQFQPQPLPKLTQTARLAIVVFTKQQSKQFFLYKPSLGQKMITFFCSSCTPLSNFMVKNQRVSIQRAPEPDDIVWQNCKISIGGSICRKIFFNFIAIIVLLIGGGAQYGLALLQNKVSDQLTKQLFSIALSLIVAAFNYIILQFLVFSSNKQRNQTLTQLNTVLTVKISFFQFLNTGIFVVLANFFADIQNFTISQSLSSDITIVMIANALTPNFSLWFMSYFQITQKLWRFMVRRQWLKYSQIDANQLWEGPKAQIPYKYAYILKTLWLTAFYAPLVPLVVPIAIIGLVLNYAIQKHLYRFVYSVPNMLSSMVNDSAIELMQYFPLIMALGQFVVYIYMVKYDPTVLPLNWSIPIYISIGLSLLNLLLPMDQLNKCFKLKSDDIQGPPYEKVEEKFQVTYQMTNPGYQCQKRRKRDVFLFNQIFGGQGKELALNLSQMFGLGNNDNTQRGMKDPLLGRMKNKNELLNNVETNNNPNTAGQNTPNNFNFISNLLENNNQITKGQQKNVAEPGGKNNQLLNPNNPKKDQTTQNNPFAALMNLNGITKDNNMNINSRENNNPNSLGNNNTNSPDSNINNEANNIFKFVNSKKASTPTTNSNPNSNLNSNLNSNPKSNPNVFGLPIVPQSSSSDSPTNNNINNPNIHPSQFIKKPKEIPTPQNQENSKNNAQNKPNSNNNIGSTTQANKNTTTSPLTSNNQKNPNSTKFFPSGVNNSKNNNSNTNSSPNNLVNSLRNPNPFATIVNPNPNNLNSNDPNINNQNNQNPSQNIQNPSQTTQNHQNPPYNTVNQRMAQNKPQLKPQNKSNPIVDSKGNLNTGNSQNNQPNQQNPVNSSINNKNPPNNQSLPVSNKQQNQFLKNLASNQNNKNKLSYHNTVPNDNKQQQPINQDDIKPIVLQQIQTIPNKNIVNKNIQPGSKAQENKIFTAIKPNSTQIKQEEKLKNNNLTNQNAKNQDTDKKQQNKINSESQNQKDFSKLKKKQTQNKTVFYQTPDKNVENNKKFPQVEIHVPKTTEQKQKRRSFGKNQPLQYQQNKNINPLSKPTQANKKNVQQYSSGQIYNPRFNQKKPINIHDLYGPPTIPGLYFKNGFTYKQNTPQNQKKIQEPQEQKKVQRRKPVRKTDQKAFQKWIQFQNKQTQQ